MVGSYGFATAVSLARVGGLNHFPSDVLVGAVIGELIGRYVVHIAFTCSAWKGVAYTIGLPLCKPLTRNLAYPSGFKSGNCIACCAFARTTEPGPAAGQHDETAFAETRSDAIR